MKHNLSLLVGAALLGLASGAVAATAVTDPVGYVTTDLAPLAGGVRGDTFFGPTLYQKPEFSGAVATAAAGGVINFAGTPFTANQFNGAAGAYFLEITSGAGEGWYSDITATTASSVTTGDDMTANLAAGTTVKIRKHHTIASIFGATNSAGLQAGATIDDADNIIVLDPVTQVPKTVFYSTDEFTPGWIDAGLASQANLVIAPSQGLLIKRAGATPLSLVQVGHVKLGKTVFAVEQGENIVSVPLATGTTLQGSTLGTTITAGPTFEEADNVVVNTGLNQFKSFIFSTDEFAQGWIDASLAASGTVALKEGSAILIKNTVPTAATAFNVTFPAQVVSTP